TLEQIVGYNLALVAGHRSQRGTTAPGGVSGCIDRRIRNALQELVDLHAAPRIPLDARLVQIHVVDLGHPSGAVNHEIRLKVLLSAVARRAHAQAVAVFVDGGDAVLELEVDADLAAFAYELIDEFRIEALQRPLAAVQDRNPRSGSRRHVRELHGNVAAS